MDLIQKQSNPHLLPQERHTHLHHLRLSLNLAIHHQQSQLENQELLVKGPIKLTMKQPPFFPLPIQTFSPANTSQNLANSPNPTTTVSSLTNPLTCYCLFAFLTTLDSYSTNQSKKNPDLEMSQKLQILETSHLARAAGKLTSMGIQRNYVMVLTRISMPNRFLMRKLRRVLIVLWGI